MAKAAIERALVRLGAGGASYDREALIFEVESRLREGQLAIVMVQGLVGSGRTVLLGQVVRRVQDRFDDVVILSMKGPSSIEPAYLHDDLNKYLTDRGRGMPSEDLHRLPHERAMVELASRLADEHALVVLDAVDAVAPTWLRTICETLSNTAGIHLLVALTERVEGSFRAHIVPVPPLSDIEALSIIALHAQLLGLDAEPAELVQRLPASVTRHPGTLVATLARLRDLPLDFVLADLTGHAGDAFSLISDTIRSLDEHARRLIAYIELMGDLELKVTFDVLDMEPPTGLVRALSTLLERSLSWHTGGGAYGVPAIVWAALASVDQATVESVTVEVASAWKRAMLSGAVSDDRVAVLAVIGARCAYDLHRTKQWQHLAELADETLLEMLNTRGFWKEYSLILRLCIEAVAKLKDNAKRVRLGFRLARKLFQMNDVDGARATLADTENLIDRGHPSLELAELHSHRALVHQLEKDGTGVLRDLEESARLRTELGDHEGLALVEKLMGNFQLRRGRIDDARQAYLSVLEALRDSHHSTDALEAQTSLALCDIHENDLAAAESRLRVALEGCRTAKYEAEIPRVLLHLAMVAERRGVVTQALNYARMAATKATGTNRAVAAAARLMASRLDTSGSADSN